MRTALLVAVLAVLVPTLAFPCDCAVSARNLSEALDGGASVVFEGRVEKLPEWGAGRETQVTYGFLVTRAWRGVRAGDHVSLTTSASNCGFHFAAEGATALVAVPAVDAGVPVHSCQRDAWVSHGANVEKDRAVLGPPSSSLPPTPAPAPAAPKKKAAK